MEEREKRRAALHSALMDGFADSQAGRVRDIDEVFDALEAEIDALPERHA